MSLTATARSVGDTLRQEVLVDGRHRLTTDEPAQLGGTDTGPAPHELVPAALAACVAVTIRMYARTKGWTLGELSVDVVYDNTSTPRHFDVTVNLPRDLTPRAGPAPDARTPRCGRSAAHDRLDGAVPQGGDRPSRRSWRAWDAAEIATCAGSRAKTCASAGSSASTPTGWPPASPGWTELCC